MDVEKRATRIPRPNMTRKSAVLTMVLSVCVVSEMRAQALFVKEATTGMTKQCFYDYLGSAYTKTVNSYELCPLSLSIGTPKPQATTPSPTERRGATGGGNPFLVGVVGGLQA